MSGNRAVAASTAYWIDPKQTTLLRLFGLDPVRERWRYPPQNADPFTTLIAPGPVKVLEQDVLVSWRVPQSDFATFPQPYTAYVALLDLESGNPHWIFTTDIMPEVTFVDIALVNGVLYLELNRYQDGDTLQVELLKLNLHTGQLIDQFVLAPNVYGAIRASVDQTKAEQKILLIGNRAINPETGALLFTEPPLDIPNPFSGPRYENEDIAVVIAPGLERHEPYDVQPRPSIATAYRKGSSKLLWRYEFTPLRPESIWARIAGDFFLLRVQDQLHKIDLTTGTPLWQTTLLDYTAQSFLLKGNTLYIAGKNGKLYALDWQSGFVYWSQNLLDTLDPGLSDLQLFQVDADQIWLTGYTGDNQVIAQLQPDAKLVAPLPTPTATPTATPTVTPTATPIALPINLTGYSLPTLQAPPTLVSELNWDDNLGVPAIHADLDDDGIEEWLILVEQITRTSGTKLETQPPGDMATPIRSDLPNFQGWDYLLFEQRNGKFESVAVIDMAAIAAGGGDPRYYPYIIGVEDINHDGRKEIIIYSRACGASTCSTLLTFWQWDGQRFHDLTSRYIELPYVKFHFVDLDHDGSLEIEAVGGTTGSAGTGFQRPHRFVYKWQEEQYRLVEETPIAVDFALFTVVDAQRLIHQEKYEEALLLANRTVFLPNGGTEGIGYLTEDELARVVTYAAIQAIYIHGLRGEIGAMQAYLREVETQDAAADNPYLPIARFFLQSYLTTTDMDLSCRLLRQAIVNLGDDATLLRHSTPSTETANPLEICPVR